MIKLLLMTSLVVLGLGTRLNQMTREKMGKLKNQKRNYLFHLVFINESFIAPFEQRMRKNFIPNLILYETDCEKTKFPQCMNKKQYPVFMIYNKVLMHFPGKQTSFQSLFQWTNTTVFRKPISNISSKCQLQKILDQQRQVFIMLASNGSEAQSMAFSALSKQFYFSTFVYLKNQTTGQELNLKAGVLCQMGLNMSESVCLRGRASYEGFSSFVLEKFISFLPGTRPLVGKRFLNETMRINTYIIGCDISFSCLKFWKNLAQVEAQLANFGLQFKKVIIGYKQNDLFETYFHIKLNSYRNPILIHISQSNTDQTIGMPKRYLRQINHTSSIIPSIRQFIDHINNNEVDELLLSQGELKNNGFYGKGGEKYVQKLSYETYWKQISECQLNYVVLINRFNKECAKCENLYAEYKKSMGYLSSEGLNFRYGVIDIDRNQIDIPEIRGIPEILLYKAGDKKKGIRVMGRQFSALTRSLRRMLGGESENGDL